MDKMRIAAEVMKRGGSLLGEPCKVCGGVLVRYKDKVFCIVHEDVEKILEEPEFNPETMKSKLKEILLDKINYVATILKKEEDTQLQLKYTELLIRYFELLDKVTK